MIVISDDEQEETTTEGSFVEELKDFCHPALFDFNLKGCKEVLWYLIKQMKSTLELAAPSISHDSHVSEMLDWVQRALACLRVSQINQLRSRCGQSLSEICCWNQHDVAFLWYSTYLLSRMNQERCAYKSKFSEIKNHFVLGEVSVIERYEEVKTGLRGYPPKTYPMWFQIKEINPCPHDDKKLLFTLQPYPFPCYHVEILITEEEKHFMVDEFGAFKMLYTPSAKILRTESYHLGRLSFSCDVYTYLTFSMLKTSPFQSTYIRKGKEPSPLLFGECEGQNLAANKGLIYFESAFVDQLLRNQLCEVTSFLVLNYLWGAPQKDLND